MRRRREGKKTTKKPRKDRKLSGRGSEVRKRGKRNEIVEEKRLEEEKED